MMAAGDEIPGVVAAAFDVGLQVIQRELCLVVLDARAAVAASEAVTKVDGKALLWPNPVHPLVFVVSARWFHRLVVLFCPSVSGDQKRGSHSQAEVTRSGTEGSRRRDLSEGHARISGAMGLRAGVENSQRETKAGGCCQR